MTRSLYRLARWCADHAILVVVLWLVAVLGLIAANRLLPQNNPGSFELSGTDSGSAQVLLEQAFPGSGADATPLLVHSDVMELRSGDGLEVVTDVEQAVRALPFVTKVVGPVEQTSSLSDDGHTAMISIIVTEQEATSTASGESILSAAEEATADDGVQVALGGLLGQKVSSPDTHQSEVLGLVAALLVLFVTLRRVTATFIPLVSALLAVAAGLAIIDLLGRVVFIPDVAPTLGTMLGLGVGIDYALFMLTRLRTLLGQGYAVPDAVGRTAGTAGAGMVFAGSTLIAALVGLAFTGLSFLAWLGYAAAIVVAVAVLASITFVPALLGLARRSVVSKSGKDAPDDADHDSSVWGRLANAVTRRPWRFAIGASVVLALLAAPATTLQLGHTDSGIFPEDTTARQAYDLTTAAFGPGATAPLAVVAALYTPATAPPTDDSGRVVVDPGTPPPEVSAVDPGSADTRRQDPRLIELRDELAATPGIVQADEPVVSTDGGVAIVRVLPQWSGSDQRTADLVEQLRAEVLPAFAVDRSMAPHVGGVTAATTDLSTLIAQKTPWFIAGVVTLAFLLLMMAYRSLLIPLKAAVMNLLSIAAAYGVVVMVFQWGWGATLIGLDGPVPIESYVPMMLFAVLFGLSMDYEVFLLTSFREQWERTGDMVVSVRRGLSDTGKVVTSAALIMCVVFGSFVLSDNAIVKMFGVGLATAVFVDATVVRCMLVPAIMVLAQKGTWWLPAWLDRLLPHLHVEGDPRALDEETTALAEGRRRQYHPGPVLWASAGALVGWLVALLFALGIGAVPGTGTFLPAAAMSALAGAVLTRLPLRRPDGRRWGLGFLVVGYTVGAVGVVLMMELVGAVGDPARGSGWAVGWAVALAGIALVLGASRTIVVPVVVGALVMLVAVLAGAGTSSGSGPVLLVVLGPALLAIAVYVFGMLLTGDSRRPSVLDQDALVAAEDTLVPTSETGDRT